MQMQQKIDSTEYKINKNLKTNLPVKICSRTPKIEGGRTP